ncbi:MAG: TraR/DksA C4-type zinc finger protein [Bdellovibrionales bacterium]|nr:TraR/DksA C4-type zinc finger protein [Bdellovibrionales bacterium]
MRKTDLVRFRRIFTEQKNQILMNSGMLDEGFVNSPEDKDEVDQANANIEQAMRLQLRNRETFTLSRINDALRRIDDGSFGRCDTCDEYIELRRLQARPTTTLCISCKEEEEKMNASAILGHRLQAVH